ncbi:hypothetical protein ACH5RR_002044 [Cinchona calisaya]|uniref:Pentatricopeptide repeat-containing protein At1g16830 n=1 Tax=Cinchona calisaya TaxID=153742 RepID=A0ABD3B5S0_9GENT
MLWRLRYRLWKVLQLKPTSYFVVKKQSLASICILASPTESSRTDENNKKFEPFLTRDELYSKSSRNFVLSPQIVHKTLVDCSSDVVALSFFLWCARQLNYFHDRAAFDHMVNVVSRLVQRFLTVRGILEELALVGCAIKPQTLLLLLRIFWCGGLYELVFEALEEMIHRGYTPNTFARNIAMDVMFKIQKVDVALRVLEETEVPNFLTFSIAICNLCKLNDLDNMRTVLRNMLKRGYYLNPNTFLSMLNCYCKMGRLEEALQLLSLMITLGVPTSVNVWTLLIDGFCKSGQLDVASYLLDKMVGSGCSLNIVTCTSLVKGFLESEMPNKAFKILSTMESKGCYPDLFLCNVLIDGLSKMGRYDEALEFFSNLQQQGLIPDPYTICSILSTICSSREFLLLPWLISGLVVEPDLVMCNSLLNYFCKAGHPTGAVEFYNDMIDRGFKPDKYSYAGLLSGLCRSGRIHEAVNVYNGIVLNHLGLDAHVHTIIIDGLIKTGNFHGAIKFFRKAALENFPLDVVSYTVAINGLLRGGRAGEAYNLFVQMKDLGATPNIYTYNLILSSFCKDRDVKMIKGVLQEMSDVGVEMDSNTFNLLKNFLYKWHNFRSVFELFVELWDSGLLPKEMCALLIDERNHDSVADDARISNIVKLPDAGIEGSDEVCCLAASVG